MPICSRYSKTHSAMRLLLLAGLSCVILSLVYVARLELTRQRYVEHHDGIHDGEPEQVAIGAAPVHPRSPKWPTFRRHAMDRLGWRCAACDSAVNLNLHHKQSFRTNPELELDEQNVIVLCRGCHLKLGHDVDGPDGPAKPNWRDSNPNVERDVRLVRQKLDSR